MENIKVQKETSVVSSNAFYQKEENSDDIDLIELWRAIWLGKKVIILIVFVFGIVSVITAINKPNIYRATVLLSPAGDQRGASGLANMAGQLGGLASLAGISLGSAGVDKTGLALEVLKSRLFIETFIQKYNLLVPLVAAKGWDAKTNVLLLDDDIYNEKNNVWIREVDAPKKPEPTAWEAYIAFSDLLSVSVDKDTGMITVAVEYYSPVIAKQWLISLVHEINRAMREQDRAEAQRSIDFLNDKLKETQLSDMQTVFYQLIEEQTKTIMLAEVSDEYVLKTIDPPNVSDEKFSPNRPLIVVLGIVLGLVLSILFVVIRYYARNDEDLRSATQSVAISRT